MEEEEEEEEEEEGKGEEEEGLEEAVLVCECTMRAKLVSVALAYWSFHCCVCPWSK